MIELFKKNKNIIILVIIFLIGLVITWTPEKKEPVLNTETKIDIQPDLEYRLETILSKMEGVKSANVMITFYSGLEKVPAVEQRAEQEVSETFNRLNEEKKVATYKGGEEPLIVKEINPEIKGVIVIAEGAEDAITRNNIHEAVKTVLGIPIHKVQVFPKKIGG